MANDRSNRHAADQAAYQILYRQHRDRLLSRVHSFVRDHDRAQDVTSAAFEAAWAKREQFRGESALSTWLHAIALNEARHAWRQARAGRVESSDREAGECPVPTQDDLTTALERQEVRARVWQVLNRVPAKYSV